MHLIRAMMLALLALFLISPCAAADTPRPHDEIALYESKFAEMKAELAEAKRLNGQGEHADSLNKQYENYLVAFYSQDLKLRQHQLRVFEWQVFSANVILLLVAILILSGVGFSGFQLWKGRKSRSQAGANMDVEISAQKVRIQSSVIGVVVLTISGLFLLLFAKEIYRIETIPIAPPQQVQGSTAAR